MRLKSLDVFRGITIASMILVNNPGNWNYVYQPLLHAKWHGCTPTDLIFPFFLFIAGVAMTFSLSKYTDKNKPTPQIYQRTFRRCLILFLLGLLLNGFPNYNLNTIRIMGVLQRISLAYLFAAIAILNLSRKQLYWLSATLLIGYSIAMQLIPVPGHGIGNLSPEGNLGAYIDRLILTQQHLWANKPYDPEGLFSTLPAIVTVLIGYFTGEWLKSQSIKSRTSLNLVISGLICLVVGYLWGIFFPINKVLWTSSYVIFTAGYALLLLAICYEVIEVRGWQKWGYPFQAMGLNAIFIFVGSGLLARLMIYNYINSAENSPNIKTWIYEQFFQSWAGSLNGSLIFAIVNVLFWWGISDLMYRRNWFIKV
ncbi:heparan-alpha-glucosaminide N-acetyltransferase domain-containing protein [Okeania sp.]|uniref:acyltransferase family protein n=1 Tax=Okeania sp. TaxID=3100323 RepID=UPI002B4B2F1E|nr:heparan-alpha-glucosaminide N-acetyltransferase domain-containing protein [Okeania sp.]MEB3342775.1 heparan-alpha-glucosaminide N-acetyltransferase domain-containing protein [Okeania sp.]